MPPKLNTLSEQAASGAGRRTQVNEWCDGLKCAIEENGKLIAQIGDKFEGVLRSDMQGAKSSDGQNSAPQEVLVPLAELLRKSVEALECSNAWARSILNRAEI